MVEEASARSSARIGVRDVARLAGVSPQTVSRALSDHAGVRPETRERVLAAASTLGYRMNNLARALGTRTTRTIGVIASDAELYGPSSGIAAVEAAARARGRWIATAYADGADPASVDAAVQHLLSQGVDGIVMVAPHTRTFDALVASEPGVAVRALHGGAGAQGQRRGARVAIEHLVALGHRRIAEVAGPADWLEAAARSGGVAEGLAAAGLATCGRWEGDWSAATGYALAATVSGAAAAPDGPTAVTVANDQMALGLISGLRGRGVEVPAGLSITGFDDNPDAAYYRPALTTVRIDLSGEARRAVAEIVAASSRGGADRPPRSAGRAPEPTDPGAAPADREAELRAVASTPPVLVVRASTARPRR